MRFLLQCGAQSSTDLGDPNEAAPTISGSAPVPLPPPSRMSTASLAHATGAHATWAPTAERHVAGIAGQGDFNLARRRCAFVVDETQQGGTTYLLSRLVCFHSASGCSGAAPACRSAARCAATEVSPPGIGRNVRIGSSGFARASQSAVEVRGDTVNGRTSIC